MSPTHSEAAEGTAQTSAGARSGYILVAEADLRRAARALDLLEPFGLGCLVARDADEAIKILKQFGPPALLLASVGLPRPDGLSLIAALRAISPPEHSSIIVTATAAGIGRVPDRSHPELAIGAVVPHGAPDHILRQAIENGLRAVGCAVPHAAEEVTRRSRLTVAEDLLRDATTSAMRLTAARGAAVYVKMYPLEEFRAHVDWGSKAYEQSPLAAPFVFDRVLQTGDAIVIPDVDRRPTDADRTVTLSEVLRGVAAVPIRNSAGGVTGALCVFDVTPLALDRSTLDRLTALGSELGRRLDTIDLAEATLRSYAIPESGATTAGAIDSVTGLATQQGSATSIRESLARAAAERRPSALILLAIDHVSTLRSYDVAAAEQLARMIGQAVRTALRDPDLAIRWEADEFLLVLPGVSLSTAQSIAERVRKGVAGIHVRDLPQVTVSAGVTEVPPGGEFREALERTREQLPDSRQRRVTGAH